MGVTIYPKDVTPKRYLVWRDMTINKSQLLRRDMIYMLRGYRGRVLVVDIANFAYIELSNRTSDFNLFFWVVFIYYLTAYN